MKFNSIPRSFSGERAGVGWLLARQERLELPARCLEGSCSIRLSYWRAHFGTEINGAVDRPLGSNYYSPKCFDFQFTGPQRGETARFKR